MDVVRRMGWRWFAASLAMALLVALLAAPTAAQAATPDAVELTTACEGTESAGFTDTKGTTFEFEIDCFAHNGYTKGTGNGSTYEPFAKNTRWQMAAFIHRVLVDYASEHDEFEVPEPSDQGFDDIGSLPKEFRDAINVLAELGVVEGKSPGRYAPHQSVRRDQMASFINRATGAIFEQTGDDPNGFTTDDEYFPDVDGNVHEDNINGIASVGIVQGRNDGGYHPRDAVNRGQMSAFIMRWVQVLLTGTGGDACDTALVGVEVVDTNANGDLDVGDLVGLNFDGDVDELSEEGGDSVIRFEDGDGSVLEIETGDGNSVVDDDGLGGDLVGDDGAIVVGIGGDSVVGVEEGDTAGLALDGHLLSLGDAFTLTGCDDPISIGDGNLQVLDLEELGDEALQDIVDQIDGLLGDLLGDAGDDVLNIDALRDGDLGDLFNGLPGGVL